MSISNVKLRLWPVALPRCYNPNLPPSPTLRPLPALILGRDDSDLIAAIRSRDPQAMGLLYDRYGRSAYSLILRIVHDVEIAEDVLAETFVTVWNRLGGLAENRADDFGQWILCLARNNAFEHLRSARGWLGNDLPNLPGLESVALFQQTVRDREPSHWRALQLNYAALSERERHVLELASLDGLSPSDMSLLLERPLSDIRSWIAGALAKLSSPITPPRV